jgi:hypothetical protein
MAQWDNSFAKKALEERLTSKLLQKYNLTIKNPKQFSCQDLKK